MAIQSYEIVEKVVLKMIAIKLVLEFGINYFHDFVAVLEIKAACY